MNLAALFPEISPAALLELEQILHDPRHPRFVRRLQALLARCDRPDEVFALVSKDDFIAHWPRVRRYWRQLGETRDFLAWWESVYEELVRRQRGTSAKPKGVSDEMRELGRRLRDKRLQRGWTQAELARRAGLCQPDISAIERGKLNITVAKLRRLRQILDGESAVLDLILPYLPEDLENLHRDENDLRARSVLALNSSAASRDHLAMITTSAGLFYRLVMDSREKNENELAMLALGCRLYNSSAAALRLALTGYYQPALTMIRDMLETNFLLDYFSLDSDTLVTRWRTASPAERKKEFAPAAIRKALDKRDGFKEKKREAAYRRLCELGAHPTWNGFALISEKQEHGLTIKMGPFLNEGTLHTTIGELVKTIVQAATSFAILLPIAEDTIPVRQQYLAQFAQWQAKYLPDRPPAS